MDTKKLLEGLGGDGISVRALATYTMSVGVYVDVHCSRYRGCMTLPRRLVIKGKLKDETKEAYDKFVKLGSLCFIPREYEAQFCNIERNARNIVARDAIADGFVPTERYMELKTDFEQLRDEYAFARDCVVDNWDEIMADFETGVDTMITSARILKRDRPGFKKAILNMVPSKEKYKKSFSLSLGVRAFPGMPDTSVLDPAIQKDVLVSWKDMVVENATVCIGALAQEVFTMCNNVAARYAETDNINGNSTNSLILLGEKVKKNNVFSNPLLQEAGDNLCGLSKMADSIDRQEEVIEDVLMRVYQYAKDTGIELKFDAKKGLTQDILENMLACHAA